MASAISSSEISSISPSTIITESAEAPTIISRSAFSSCSKLGLITSSPSIRATLTSEIGVSKGMSETWIAAEAAKPARASGITSGS